MKPDSEKLRAALSVLNSWAMRQTPDENALAVIDGEQEHPDGAAPDEIARAVVKRYLLEGWASCDGKWVTMA